jgi:hypothetical protein
MCLLSEMTKSDKKKSFVIPSKLDVIYLFAIFFSDFSEFLKSSISFFMPRLSARQH